MRSSLNRRDPVPFSHPHFPTLIELILPSWPSWALALPPEAWYDSLGCGIWFNSFSFLVPRPRSERNRGLPVELRRIWPAAKDASEKTPEIRVMIEKGIHEGFLQGEDLAKLEAFVKRCEPN